MYAGTKAYVDCFSRSLDGEYAPLGVRVQNQAPMFVATKMSKIRCLLASLDVLLACAFCLPACLA